MFIAKCAFCIIAIIDSVPLWAKTKPSGNLLRDIDNKTVRRIVYICSLLSNTQFVRKQLFEIAVFELNLARFFAVLFFLH